MRNDIRDFLDDIVGYSENARDLVRANEMKQLAEKFSAEGLALQRCADGKTG